MTSVVLVDTGGTMVEYVTAEEDPQQEGVYEADAELEGEVEDEYEAEEVCEELEEVEEADEDLAVVVEEAPTASRLDEQGYSAQVVVYGDEAYVMQEVETEGEGGGEPNGLFLLPPGVATGSSLEHLQLSLGLWLLL